MSIIVIDGPNWSIFTEERFKLDMSSYIYSIFDLKANAFLNLFVMKRDEQAKRAFADLVNNAQTDISRHPEDYRLYNLGSWDQIEGDIKSNVVLVCDALNVMAPVYKHELNIVYNDKDPALVKDEDIV